MTEKKQTQLYHVYVDTLKEAFKEGATPNEKDYGALIDLAAVGSKALGAKDATPTTPEPGEGLEIAQNKLAVKAGKGVIVDGNGVAVKGDGKSVRVTENGVGVQVKPDGGLTTDDGQGLHVKLGAGVTSTADGLAIHLADKSGLKADKAGLAVNVAAGLGIDGKGALEVKVKTGSDNYITSGTDGLAITPGGVKAIEAALKSVSLGALKKADDATSHGFRVDATPAGPNEGVQKQIAEKLNEAFTEGWHLTQPRAALFTALKAFRTANTGKINEGGLIAPSAVTGKTGLYNQEGVEYGAGMVIAFKVNPAGEALEVKAGAYTEDGIYALVGKLDKDGVPKAGDPVEKVTPNALMVLVAQKVVTVVGHWDFTGHVNGAAATDGVSWGTGQLADVVAEKAIYKTVDENRSRRDKESLDELFKVLDPMSMTCNGQKIVGKYEYDEARKTWRINFDAKAAFSGGFSAYGPLPTKVPPGKATYRTTVGFPFVIFGKGPGLWMIKECRSVGSPLALSVRFAYTSTGEDGGRGYVDFAVDESAAPPLVGVNNLVILGASVVPVLPPGPVSKWHFEGCRMKVASLNSEFEFQLAYRGRTLWLRMLIS